MFGGFARTMARSRVHDSVEPALGTSGVVTVRVRVPPASATMQRRFLPSDSLQVRPAPCVQHGGSRCWRLCAVCFALARHTAWSRTPPLCVATGLADVAASSFPFPPPPHPVSRNPAFPHLGALHPTPVSAPRQLLQDWVVANWDIPDVDGSALATTVGARVCGLAPGQAVGTLESAGVSHSCTLVVTRGPKPPAA